jgi:hypothetical protein
MPDAVPAIVRSALQQGGVWGERLAPAFQAESHLALGPFEHDEIECRRYRLDPDGPNLLIWTGAAHKLALLLKLDGGAPP